MPKAVQLGENSGLHVSQLGLGTMNFGEPGRGHQADWTLGLDDSWPIFRAAIERRLSYFDCADSYGRGACEKVVGRLLKELLPRDEYVLGTKIAFPVGVSRIEQLDELIAAAEITLYSPDIEYLEELYRPVENLLSLGFS